MTAPITPPVAAPPAQPPAAVPPVATPPAPAQTPAGTPPVDDRPLGPAGERALAAEREARKTLEKQLAPFLALVGNAPGTPPVADPLAALQERFASHEAELKTERTARWRAEVAAETGLSPAQAARLVGGNRDELLADAATLKALFPAASGGASGDPNAPRTPAPDPSQGSRGAPVDLDSEIAAAEKENRWQDVIVLKRQKAARK